MNGRTDKDNGRPGERARENQRVINKNIHHPDHRIIFQLLVIVYLCRVVFIAAILK